MGSCPSSSTSLAPDQRLEVLFEQLAELAGQRNAIDGRIVDIVAEMDRDELCGATGRGRWRRWWPGNSGVLGQRPHHHHHRRAARAVSPAAPRACARQLSLDQVGVIAARAAEGSDEHYAQLAAVATVNQLRTAVKLEPARIRAPARTGALDHHDRHRGVHQLAHHLLPHDEAAIFDAAPEIPSRRPDRRDWKADHDTDGTEQSPPLPNTVDGFLRLIEAGWDAEATRRPHGRTPPSWSTSTSSAAPPPCTWARCSPMPNAGI